MDYHFGVGGGFSARTKPRNGGLPSEHERDDVAVTGDDVINVGSSSVEDGF